MARNSVRRHPWLTAGVVVGLSALLVVGVFLATWSLHTQTPIDTRPTIDRDSAVALAREYFGGAYGAGARVSDIGVEDATLGSDTSGRAAWRVTIHGHVVAGGGTASTSMVLLVDAETGAITVIAQG